MWTRADLKSNAKDVLRKYYWWALLVCFVGGLFSGQGVGELSINFGNIFNLNTNNNDFNSFDKSADFNSFFSSIDWTFIAPLIAFFVILLFFIFVLSITYQIFIGNVIIVGINKYFLEAKKDKSKFSNLFYSFNGQRYLNIVIAMAWKELFVFLWSLLFIIPGIIKGISYSMVPYIMAENPKMRYDDAIKLSMKMTCGEKAEIFVLGLSFLGWFLLGILLCFVGILFVYPYYYATFAELYITLRDKAISNGNATLEDFGIVRALTIEQEN